MRSLDRCQVCSIGKMLTYRSLRVGFRLRKYLKCNHCGETGKEIIPIDHLGRPIYANVVATSGNSTLGMDTTQCNDTNVNSPEPNYSPEQAQ